jgi:hypothetical protein
MAFCQVQGNVGLQNMSDPRHLDLAGDQIQDNVGLANMPNPRHLDLTFCQVQVNDHYPLGTPKRNNHPLLTHPMK